MRGPVITQAELDNQRDVVKNEIRVNVLNRPYGSFPWLDMQAAAFDNWHNSHNGYGDVADLDAASLEDVQAFFRTYYSPANAALVLVGALAHLKDELATAALRGMNPTAYGSVDLIAIVADAGVRQVLQPRSLPWESAR